MPRDASAGDDSISIALRMSASAEVVLRPKRALLDEAAVRWCYTVQNRRRWMRSKSAGTVADESKKVLEQLGLTAEQLASLALASLLEVGIPYSADDDFSAARAFPWEYVLSAATESSRGGRLLIVVRHLDRLGTAPPPLRRPTSLLVVESAPGEVAEVYSFTSELRSIFAKAAPSLPDQAAPPHAARAEKLEQLSNPTRADLETAIRRVHPDVVHLAGCDNWEVTHLLELPDDPAMKDGYALRGSVDLVPAEELARILTVGAQPPLLVTCNFWNSSTQTAALLAAAGVRAAIGFQDEFDNALGELFFANFYQAWWLSGGDTHLAFQEACKTLWAQPDDIVGSGVALWSLESAFAPAQSELPRPSRRLGRKTAVGAAAPPAGVAADLLRTAIAQQKQQEVIPGPDASPRDLLQVEIVPRDRLNYSILHNHRGLLERFRLRKTHSGILRDIEIEVLLHAGADSFPFRMTLDLQEDIQDLASIIRVPLTSALGRGLREGVRTAMLVQVTWQRARIYHNTLPVTLLAVDEWRDDDLDRVWLPSFVLPRDPTVARIIAAAHRYLMVLEDSTEAGFDGYQSIDPSAADPTGYVDLQVQSVWASLLHDLPLGYINPPPTFTNASQRLRTPADVVEGRRGTCIDLALLLASCLEYIDVYPVLFLLQGHAFPGYWRSAAAHEQFKEARGFAMASPDGTGRSSEPWYLDRRYYGEIMEWINGGHLVPIETVALTRQDGFGTALAQGLQDLRSKDEFQAMIDVRLARDNDVTPLPITREVER